MDPKKLSDEAQDAFDRDLNDHLDRIIPADEDNDDWLDDLEERDDLPF